MTRRHRRTDGDSGRRCWPRCCMVLGLTSATGVRAADADRPRGRPQQSLTWTAGDDITKYASAPDHGGRGQGHHRLREQHGHRQHHGHAAHADLRHLRPRVQQRRRRSTSWPTRDAQGGKHTAEVTLTPGRYRYHCTIPGHGAMQGILVVTERRRRRHHAAGDLGEGRRASRTPTAPTSAAPPSPCPPPTPARASTPSSTRSAPTAPASRTPTPVMVDDVGTPHRPLPGDATRRATPPPRRPCDFTVVAPPDEDTTPPETAASVDGHEELRRRRTSASATVTVTATDAGSGVGEDRVLARRRPVPRLHRPGGRRPRRPPHRRPPGDRQGGQHLRPARTVSFTGRRGRRGPRAQLRRVRRAADGDRRHGRHGRAQPHHPQPLHASTS